MDFRLLDNDLEIVNNELVKINGADETAQRLKQRLQFFLGECFFAKLQGIPYFQEIFKKGTPISSISAIIKAQVIDVEGFLQLTRFDLDFVPATRQLKINLAGLSETGLIGTTVTLP